MNIIKQSKGQTKQTVCEFDEKKPTKRNLHTCSISGKPTLKPVESK